mgnify:CR=1 FL=1
MNVLIAGSSGLVGSALLALLAKSDHIGTIYALVRHIPHLKYDKVKFVLTDFASLSSVLKDIPKVDVIYSCLGTTKALTPDKDQYHAIEVSYPVQLAEWGVQQGVQQFHYISALGAKASSSNHYQQLKGKAEKELDQLNIPSVYKYRPGLLLGKRKDKRTGEAVATVVMKLLQPVLKGKWARYRAIKVETVARAMYYLCLHAKPEHKIIHNEMIETYGTIN